MAVERKSTTIVIFGASGDLTWRKLIPGLYNNFKKGRLSDCAHIIGFARRPMETAAFQEHLRQGVEQFSADSFDEDTWKKFAGLLVYFQGDFDHDDDFVHLANTLEKLPGAPHNHLYYLATAPEYYPTIATTLGKVGLAAEGSGFRRLVIEKPFGRDLASALELNRALHAVYAESQIYRIDHYLGKETAQNILFFRFANSIFEPIWNRRYIDHVQITVAESVEIGSRAGYYDSSGVLRDMFQNHLLQLLALIAMEAPASFNADAVRNETAKVLQSICPIVPADTVRGQYNGYTQAEGISPGSQTATYAVMKLDIDNWRWNKVPFYLRSGKALAKKASEITIVFQRPPHLMFDLPEGRHFTPNILSMCLQPDEGIHLRFEAKMPDSTEMRSVEMEFHYRDSFGDDLPEAYEKLLLDALDGDASLFTRSDAIEASWKLIDPLLRAWEGDSAMPLVSYQPGDWGPVEADELLSRSGRSWRLNCGEHS